MIEFLLFYWFVCILIMLGFISNMKDPNTSTIEKILLIILSWFITPVFIGVALQYNSSCIDEVEIKLSKLIDILGKLCA